MLTEDKAQDASDEGRRVKEVAEGVEVCLERLPADVRVNGPEGLGEDGSRAQRTTLAQLFGLEVADGLNSDRRAPRPIEVTVMPRPSRPSLSALVPDIDPAYVFPVDTLKSLLIGLELNYNTYLVGHTGVGKTTLIEQVCARTNRPLLRMQHSSATEESHIVGQWTARATAGASETVFQLGPLPMAMQEGLVYLMDEVDFALPSVMAVYQAVLEHRPLVIPEAPPELRVIRPHPDFRIVGTGNSNGSGDGTGLYQGVRIQNLATFSRWTICEQVDYMPADVEGRALAKQAGISLQTAATFIAFAETIRSTLR